MTSNINSFKERFFKQTSVEAMITAFNGGSQSGISCGEQKAALYALADSLREDDHHLAAAIALAMLETSGEDALWEMRRLGVFRISRYGFRPGAALVSSAIAKVSTKAGIGLDGIRYLTSLTALHTLRNELKDMEDAVKSELTSRRNVVLKSILVVVDRLFLGNWTGGDTQLPGDNPLHYNVEELAEAFSTIVGMFREHVGVDAMSWGKVDADGLLEADSIYLSLLVVVCRLNQYRRAETLVDGLPFEANLNGAEITITSSDPLLEKSIRLGYIQHSQQVLIRRMRILQEYRADPKQFHTIEQVAKKLFNDGLSHFVRLEEKPERRLVFSIPADAGIESFLSFDQPFFEEVLSLLQLDVDTFSDDPIWENPVHGDVRVLDVMRVQRLFSFVTHVFREALLLVEDHRERSFLTAQSIIFVMKRQVARTLLSLAVPATHVDQVIDLLTAPEDGDYIDVQYTPLIKAGDYLVASPALLANSNLIRNIPVMQRLHRGWAVGADPMVLAVRDALKAAGFRVEIEVPFPFGNDLDGDIVALRDGVLFVFECKNAYHPCNVHELRNAYAHVLKGSKQLSLRIPALKDPELLNRLLKKLGWDDEPVVAVTGAIVTATRVFHGWQPNGYAIVQSRELMNVIGKGIINGPEGHFRFWLADQFSAADLVAYIEGHTLVSDQLESMFSQSERYPFGSKALLFLSWRFDPEQHAERLKARYRLTPAPN